MPAARPSPRSPALPRDLDERVAAAPEPAQGFFGPSSLLWRVGRENALLLAGPAALLLQIAHPAVAAGVAEHSRFERDPFGRLRRTFDIVDRVIFGDVAEAAAAAARARRIHHSVRGVLPEPAGRHRAEEPYCADRGDLLLWVHATLVQQSLRAHPLFVGPLGREEPERYYAESRRFGRLFGVPEALLPPDLPAFHAYFDGMVRDTLAVGACGMRLRRALLGGIPWSWPLAPAGFVLAGGLLPPRVRGLFGLPWSRPLEIAFEQLARAVRGALPHLPGRLRFGRHYRAALRRLAPGSRDARAARAAGSPGEPTAPEVPTG